MIEPKQYKPLSKKLKLKVSNIERETGVNANLLRIIFRLEKEPSNVMRAFLHYYFTQKMSDTLDGKILQLKNDSIQNYLNKL